MGVVYEISDVGTKNKKRLSLVGQKGPGGIAVGLGGVFISDGGAKEKNTGDGTA